VSLSHRTVEAAACGLGRSMWPAPASGARSMVASTGTTGDAYAVDFGATKKGVFIVDACNVGLNFKPEEVGVSPPALIYKKKGKPMDEMFPAMENLVKILGEDDVGMVKLVFDGKTQVSHALRPNRETPGSRRGILIVCNQFVSERLRTCACSCVVGWLGGCVLRQWVCVYM
jgi:hypothetical protein